MASAVKDMLRAVSAGLQIPTIVILLILVALTVVLLGSLVVEYFTERKQLGKTVENWQRSSKTPVCFRDRKLLCWNWFRERICPWTLALPLRKSSSSMKRNTTSAVYG